MSEGGKRRIPTPTGRYYEDFVVGDIYEHRPGRTITESDNINFSLMTMNQHPMHCDANFAAKSEFKLPLVNSALTLAVVVGMTVNDVSLKAIANLGWRNIDLTGPVFPGDTLYAELEVLEKRELKSRPTQGIVTVETRACKQDGKPVMNFVRTALLPKRGHGVGD